ncbi:MAG: MBL fold metallo-hydrolase [Patescibacteria group bacterium]
MIITYFGDQCFRVESGPVGILIDPMNNRLKGDILLRTSAPTDSLPEGKTEITFAGEYEIGGIEIQGWQLINESTAKELKTVYGVTWEGVKLLFLGGLKEPLSADIIDQVGEVDVLFVPTGGDYLSPEVAVSLTKKIDPKFIIPYGPKAASEFMKKLGLPAEPQEKLVFKKKELGETEQKVILLSSNS